jgi:hypothetical protein
MVDVADHHMLGLGSKLRTDALIAALKEPPFRGP